MRVGIGFGGVGGLVVGGQGLGGARRKRRMLLGASAAVEARFGLRGTVAIDRGRAIP